MCGIVKQCRFHRCYSFKICGLIADRDVNGERNIAIKRLKELQEFYSCNSPMELHVG